MNLKRFSNRVAHALLLRCAFRHSHSAKIRIVGEQLLPHLTDPLLMNDYLRVFTQCQDVVRFSSPIASHVSLDKAPEEHWYSGYFFNNPESPHLLSTRGC